MLKPPKDVGDTFAVVATLLGEKDPTWMNCKKYMADPKALVEMLRNYDAWNIDKALARKAQKAAQDLNTSVEDITKKSKAAAPIYAWLEAVLAIAGFSPEEAPEIPETEKKLLA